MTTIIPTLRYRDARQAIDFLVDAFGFDRHAVMEGPDGAIGHAELRLGDGYVMIGTVGHGTSELDDTAGHAAIYVVVDDPDAHHARAAAAGAEITMGITDQDYGSREYGARDPEGNRWYFGTYRPS
jgi:uncharacterized glyoxalase superfamily protein PhnB